MAIPPLYQCILNAFVYIVAFPAGYRQLNGVNDMQDCYSNKRSDIEPNCDIHMTFASFDNCAKHIDSKYNPDQGNCNVNWPLHFSILMA
ncbi:hypothetical protein D9M72_596260 [compost metagenome]